MQTEVEAVVIMRGGGGGANARLLDGLVAMRE